MAKAVTSIRVPVLSVEQLQQEEMTKVNAAIAENAESVTAFIGLIAQLHRTGLLQGTSAILEQGQDIIQIVVRQAGKPEYAGGIKNAMKLAAVLGSDLTPLFDMLDAVGSAEEHAPEVSGVMSLMRAFRDPDVLSGASWLLGILKSVGAERRE